jgi:IS605 OrfB family transposase
LSLGTGRSDRIRQAITAVFDNGTERIYSGRLIMSIRRYWQKVRSKVKPPTMDHPRKSRRFRQMDRKESRQVNHLLHLMTTDFVRRCWKAGVNTIAIGDLTGIREQIDDGSTLNQRLHAWPYGKIVRMIEYKVSLYGIEVVKFSEAYSSQTCNGGEVRKANRVLRGFYWCDCGWRAHADVNDAANLF